MRLSTTPEFPAHADAATVVFITTEGGEPTSIIDDRLQLFAQLADHSYFAALVPPGRHTFFPWMHGVRIGALVADLVPGRIYYVLLSFDSGVTGIAQLTGLRRAMAERAQVSEWLATMRHIEPEPGQLRSLDASEHDQYANVMRRGIAALEHYSASEMERHRLAPEDGDIEPGMVAASPSPRSQLERSRVGVGADKS